MENLELTDNEFFEGLPTWGKMGIVIGGLKSADYIIALSENDGSSFIARASIAIVITMLFLKAVKIAVLAWDDVKWQRQKRAADESRPPG